MPQTKEEKRTKAEAMKIAASELTPQQKLKKLDEGGFRALKERARLQKQIEELAHREN